VLVAGGERETKESLSTWARAEAAQQSSGSERVARERQKEGRRRRPADGRQRTEGEADGGKKKRTGFLWAVFQFL